MKRENDLKTLGCSIVIMMIEIGEETQMQSQVWIDWLLPELMVEVAEEEMLLRPPGPGDVGRTIRWVNHFGEVENVHVRSSMVAMQEVVNVSAVRLVESLAGSDSCFDTVPLVRSCDLFRCW